MNNVESQMENGVHIVRLAKPKERSGKWLGICAFTLLAASTLFFALLHFGVIPSPAKKEEFKMPEILRIQTYLDSLPKAGAQQSDGKKLVAHLTGTAKGGQINWQGTTMNALMEDGLEIQNNRLVIPRGGLYFVYTQVVFTGSSCLEPIQLTHKVTKSSKSYNNKKQSILSSTKTACEVPSPSAWFQPMYQGGVFELEKGDVLETETTNVKSVNFNDGNTYFGIVAV
ncbi:tumor necrosis factor-like [Spea bombifrons]|uniref:tumor necrosis factor-like n=1 Tax=Spea bombifrons TaxID=233779 RepID=UPI00234940F0|nr:tumor necrosis factor-like [Spea bombifrons]